MIFAWLHLIVSRSIILLQMALFCSYFSWVIFHFVCVYIHRYKCVVQLPSCVRLFAAPWTAACQTSLSLTISWSLPKFTSIVSVMPPSHLILWQPLFLLPSIFPSIRDFSSASAVYIRWPKYWSFSFNVSPSNEYSGLMCLEIDWVDRLAVQGTFRSLL